MMKKLINRLFGVIGYQVVRSNPVITSEATCTFLEGYLTALAARSAPLTIIQCGANDGITVDPIRRFVLKNSARIRLVLIEPMPDVFDMLKKNYEDIADVKFLNIAAGPDANLRLYRIKPEYSARYLGIIATGITSFNKEYVQEKARKMVRVPGVADEDKIESILVPTRSLQSIISDYALDESNVFVQIDTEGYDDHVIYSLGESEGLPEGINYEFRHFTEDRYLNLKRALGAQDYRVSRWNNNDELAFKYR